MRVNLLFILFPCLVGLLFWGTLSGIFFGLGMMMLTVLIVITIGYMDTVLLFLLGAREVKSTEEADYHSAAMQEAYKLAVAQPRLYVYNGTLERAFVIQNRESVGLVVSKAILRICSKDELAAICFELLLQVKNHHAIKRTKVMFLIGASSWILQGTAQVLAKIVPFNDFRLSINWLIYFLINPWFEIIYKLTIGEKYFRVLENQLKDFPAENNLLLKVGSKLTTHGEIYSLTSKKLIELLAYNKSRQYQSIITLEFLPHEWDFLFNQKLRSRV
jgi:hypothetical protein